MSQRDAFEKWADSRNGTSLRSATTGDFDYALGNLLREAWQASRAAALEDAAQICDEMADGWNLQAQGARDGRYDFMAEAGDRCADEIRDAARAEGNRTPIDGHQSNTQTAGEKD